MHMPCITSIQTYRHLVEEEAFFSRQDAINERIAELMDEGGDYYPFTQQAISEAWGEFNKNQWAIIGYQLKNDSRALGQLLDNWTRQYWALKAEQRAIKELSK